MVPGKHGEKQVRRTAEALGQAGGYPTADKASSTWLREGARRPEGTRPEEAARYRNSAKGDREGRVRFQLGG